MDGYDRIVHGIDGYNVGHIFNAAAGSVYDFQIAGLTNKIMIGDGYIRSGAIPSTLGIFRNSQTSQVATEIITARNVANTNDLKLLGVDGYDRITMGMSALNAGFIFNTSVGSVFDYQVAGVSNKFMIGDGYIRFGAIPSLTGNIRNPQTANVATDVVTARNFGNTLDLKLLGVDGYDRITHGSSAQNKGQIFDTAVDGYYDFRVNSVPSAYIDGYKLAFKVGQRRHITQITSASTYNVLVTDDYIAITTLSAGFQINLPATPTLGDAYDIKDATGNAVTYNVIVSGNGKNIDGASTFVITQGYGAVTVTYTGTEWSIT